MSVIFQCALVHRWHLIPNRHYSHLSPNSHILVSLEIHFGLQIWFIKLNVFCTRLIGLVHVNFHTLIHTAHYTFEVIEYLHVINTLNLSQHSQFLPSIITIAAVDQKISFPYLYAILISLKLVHFNYLPYIWCFLLII